MKMNYRVPFNTKKRVREELYGYWDNLKKLEELKKEIIEESPPPPDGMPKGNSVGNPTESKALRMMTSRAIMVVSERLHYIQNAIDRLNEEEKEILEIIFKKRLSQKAAETYECISKAQYYNLYNKIIYLAAIELGEDVL